MRPLIRTIRRAPVWPIAAAHFEPPWITQLHLRQPCLHTHPKPRRRSLGGLLSAHMATERNPDLVPGYDGMFLRKATDLGDRLMPAFDTPTGIPANFLSLTVGQVPSPRHTWTACIGTLAIEFRLLSELTGNPEYGRAADRAVMEVFSRRSPETGLVGASINRDTGGWVGQTASIGPGVDSYYEYLLKMYLIFGDEWYLAMFVDQYVGVQRYMAVPEPWKGFSWILDVNMKSGRMTKPSVSSLAAFWPGMQVRSTAPAAAAAGYAALCSRLLRPPHFHSTAPGQPSRQHPDACATRQAAGVMRDLPRNRAPRAVLCCGCAAVTCTRVRGAPVRYCMSSVFSSAASALDAVQRFPTCEHLWTPFLVVRRLLL